MSSYMDSDTGSATKTNALICTVLEIYDVKLFKESTKEFFESITPFPTLPAVPSVPPRLVTEEIVSTRLPVKVT